MQSRTAPIIITAVGLGAFIYQVATKRLDYISILLLLLAATPWISHYISSIKLPGGVELQLKALGEKVGSLEANVSTIRETASKARKIAGATQSILFDGVGKPPRPENEASVSPAKDEVSGHDEELMKMMSHLAESMKRQGRGVFGGMASVGESEGGTARGKRVPTAATLAGDDPNKDQFGGKPESNGRRISATVEPLPDRSDLFHIHLKVISTDPSRPLMDGQRVTFYLHPTFPRKVVDSVARRGAAVLDRVAWGAFTVGVEIDDGTKLELDLSELPDAPRLFRER